MRIIIYQALVRLFGNKIERNIPSGSREENGVGRFVDFTSQVLEEILALGATHVWYTGVLKHARPDTDPMGLVKGKAGSPYAVTDWYDLDDDLAKHPDLRHKEFDDLLTRTREAGMKSIIDFIPNHVARTYRGSLGAQDDSSLEFSPDNNFYYLPGHELHLPGETQDYRECPARATGNDVFHPHPKMDDWYDTIKLNYGRDYRNGRDHFDPIPKTWTKMLEILLFWACRGVDGFRCDMAEMVPVEFWGWAIPRVKGQFPETLFIAEIYNVSSYHSYLEQGKFDLLYDKSGLYDSLRSVVEGRATAEAVVESFQKIFPLQDRLLNFIENHDEQRVASPFFAGSAERGFAAFTVSTCLGLGSALIYFGQEVGEPGEGCKGFTGEDGRTTIYDYWGVPEHQKWVNQGAFDGGGLSAKQLWLRQSYKTLLRRLTRDEVLLHGTTRFLQGTRHSTLEWVREFQDRHHRFLVNLATGIVQVSYDLPSEDSPGFRKIPQLQN